MNPRHLLVVLGVAAAMTSIPAHAGNHAKAAKEHRRADSGMHTVHVRAKRGQPAHGWRYFTDTHEGRAVVISPRGEYFYSEGDGMKLVYKGTTTT